MPDRRNSWLFHGSFILLAVAACSTGDLLGPEAPQGIEGPILLGPQCPVQTLENPCPDLPYPAWIQVRKRDGRSVTRIRAGEYGRFRVGLRPGAYVLHPESGDPFPVASDQEVDVDRGVFTEVAINFDTGIR